MSHSRCLVWSVLLISAPAPCVAGKTSKETIEFMGQKRSFHLFVPRDLPSGVAVPLLVTLHGSGRDGASLLDTWKDLAEAEKIILVGPNSRDPAYWAAPADGPDFLHDIVERLKRTYPIDPRRVYLFGHSAGAVFGLLTSLWESRYFAAAAVHAGELQSFEAEDCIATAKRKIPMVIFSGTADRAFPIQGVRFTRDTLRDAGFPISLVEIPGHDHDYYAISSRINREAWDFLKRYELPAEPYYELGMKRSPAVSKEFLGTWEGTLVGAGRRLRLFSGLRTAKAGQTPS